MIPLFFEVRVKILFKIPWNNFQNKIYQEIMQKLQQTNILLNPVDPFKFRTTADDKFMLGNSLWHNASF